MGQSTSKEKKRRSGLGKRGTRNTALIENYERSPPQVHQAKGGKGSSQKVADGPTELPPPTTPTASQELGGGLFQKYKDSHEDAVLAEGMVLFCEDLGVDPADFIMLILAWKFDAKIMGRFTHREFVKGCQRLGVGDIASLKALFPKLRQEVLSPQRFHELYQFAFSFGLDQEGGQRVLPMDMAIPLWELVFSQQPPDVLARWCNFLKATGVKGVSRDTWNLFLPFTQTIASDLSNYDESEAWPSLFDDFVEYEKCGQH